MTEENQRPPVPEGTYASRVQDIVEEERTNKILASKKREQEKIKLADGDKEFARAILSLTDNESFKIYLQYEAKEMGNRMVGAFEDSPDATLKTASFGEKMAFNKGRLYQMEHFRRIREHLVSRYLEANKIEKEIK